MDTKVSMGVTGCLVPLALLPLPQPTLHPCVQGVRYGVPSLCLFLGLSEHLPSGLEAGTHEEEVMVWPGLAKALGHVGVGEGRMPAKPQ